ncbi:MAG: type II toxin-antitoxin system Phd/YefM family antitoxin [Chloroflexota bacterium]|nr:type II toxin-antitoxin system Phd/YefM family antitoxin [Chloroflexota bacterium]
MASRRVLETSRQINELQRDAPDIVKQAERGPVAITRYGKTVAVLESPEQHRRHHELDEALERAIWSIDIQRGMADLRKGRTVPWDEAIAHLRRRFPGR